MKIKLQTDVAVWDPLQPPVPEEGQNRRGWPPRVLASQRHWIQPGDAAAVSLLAFTGVEGSYELSWGGAGANPEKAWRIAEAFNVARGCTIRAYEIQIVSDAQIATDGKPGNLRFKPRFGGRLAGEWLPQEASFIHPSTFRLLMVPAGPDLQPYIRYEPLFLVPDMLEVWLDPANSKRRFLRASPARTFDVLEATEA